MLHSIGNLTQRAQSNVAYAHSIDFFVNGKQVVLKEGEFNPTMSVADWLRSDKVKLFGTKISCGEGGCGACTVVISSYDPITGTVKHRPVNSCLTPVAQLHHCSLTTVEALGNLREGLHPVQAAIVKHHGTQCGYCTPGFVMNGYAMLLDNPHPKVHEIEEQFDGNLCRCTGYRSIADAFREFSDVAPSDDILVSPEPTKIKQHQDPFVPDYAKKPIDEPVLINYGNVKFFIPATVEQLVQLKAEYPAAKIVAGSSEVGIEVRQNVPQEAVFISSAHLPELITLNLEDDKLTFGASTCLQDIMMFCEHKLKEDLPAEKKRLLKQLHERLRYFASTQIRNTATVTGNLAHGGAVTDLSNFLLATDAIYHVKNAKKGIDEDVTIEKFFTAYRKTKLDPSDVITRFEISLMKKNEYVGQFKQAHRRDDDICIVSASMKVTLGADDVIEDIKIAYSGMAAFPQRAYQTENFLKGKKFDDSTIQAAYQYIHKDLPLDDYAPGGFVPFRRDLAESFLFKFYQQTLKEMGRKYDPTAVDLIERPVPKFTNMNCQPDNVEVLKPELKGIGNPLHHRSAQQQTTGEAVYVDDIPDPNGCLHGGYVMSSIPHGKIKSIDYGPALKAPGVVDVVTYKDVKGLNSVGDVWKDEPVFAEDEVRFIGQPIAMILADTHEHAWEAAKLVKIEYEELRPVLSIKQAVEENSFFDVHHQIVRGDTETAMKKAQHVVEGKLSINGQSHFYLETNCALAEPLEDDKIKITSSSQNPTFGQLEIARVCNIPANKVDYHVKRMGGGFGGKETRASTLTNAVSVAALKVKRPVRLSLDRQIDMATIGQRHPCETKYKVGFNNDGTIQAVELDIFFDCGWSLDLSIAVTDRALFHSDSSYYIPNLRTRSHLCKTNTITGTAFRGFGGPQGMISMETVVEHVARELKMPVEAVRWKNLYQEGQMTHFHVPLKNCNVERCWKEVDQKFNLKKMREECDKFNAEHKYRKRGVAMTPLKFGIAFTFSPLNQGNCLVHIYKDGSVLISHGGTEMGQGLHTKMCQIAASVLDIPVDLVRIDETSTDKCANTSPTAASSGSDLNGHAVYDACIQLAARLRRFRTDKNKKWKDVVMDAYLNRTDLSAHGYYSMKDVYYDWNTGIGQPFQYYTYGASAALVEIDCLTGDHQIIRSDVLFDTGESMNKGIDMGQLEGGYIQGVGWLTTEEVMKGNFEENRWIKPGKVHTNGPGYYKVPGFNDLPHEFNIGFLKDSSNSVGIFSSKAIGEPPFLLSHSVPFAIIDAIRAARKDNGASQEFQYDFPMSAPRIRELCGLKLNKK
ncbi:aldehyde oxidase and xanthine dehydrogenase, putative [Trichomonas vaginalis G3]|uniref:Aldehyde oxidase and xanthine dehydrogenase, putative n=1 Tax=Trichomonas vaginalis (strain ATCC PRA-98 / G3) TaxID=412133 RepID=A2FJG9_TRIV3|nr:xanthine dehydrogenase family [Trichomonas vaginalis G3]EAX94939.1 aldehyde oxidase and xanthine dehydrogenase, putative [Trichomonas vaginalis G3]KAI5544719.1 xanthine dehydrogenase family [Trichomonas vaginalis G3]|eukprot:XP_001307869.1 aldehyde oxidase and xanthine dehydrogenase [Trichomonas vaginalis G3]